MSELKPCPFCGGEAETLTAESMHGGSLFGVMCNECRSRGDVYDTESEAIAAWNVRAERMCEQEERGWGTEGDHARVWLTCGHDCMVPTVQDLPTYCPTCGARVVVE